MLIIKNFNQLPKKQFDETPNLLENFDQLKMSSEIRSSDHSPSKKCNNLHFLE
jgi:hypothetical protein